MRGRRAILPHPSLFRLAKSPVQIGLNGFGQDDVSLTLKFKIISDEDENQILIVYCLIDPDFITLYRKKTLTNFT